MDSGIISPLRLRWVKGVCLFRCNLPSALSAKWPRSFMCHCGDTGVERTPNKSQHTKLTLAKKTLPPVLPGFELAIFLPVRKVYQRRSLQCLAGTAMHHAKLISVIIGSFLWMGIFAFIRRNSGYCLYVLKAIWPSYTNVASFMH